MLSTYKHENIVSLLGFCDESNEKILVYEYASRRSLDSYLNTDDLTWNQRLQICVGAARGLAYLHNPGRTQQRVLHRDIKSSNILLDESWNAKISDLGLSKFAPANQQHTFLVTNVVGTLGYCDPLYIETGLLTKESDVYSFGVVLFEVLCGRLSISNKNGIHQSLTELVRHYYPQNKISDLIYSNIKDGMNPRSLDAFITIAYMCLKRDLEERPLMADVLRILESALEYQNHDKKAEIMQREGYSSNQSDYQSVSTFTRYGRLKVIAKLTNGENFHSSGIVSSIEFNHDDKLFATAGSSRRINIFDFSTMVNEPSELRIPLVEMPTRSKLSCLSWNKHTKNHIASSDYEGIVTIWDVNTRQGVMEFKEHNKRAWSVDFSHLESSMLVSGGDDHKVKIWCTKQESSVINIKMRAHICCVKYNPGSSNHIAVGSEDHYIYYYDIRNISYPLNIFIGHQKAVSYVKFLSNDELASASTDSTLCLWDVTRNIPVQKLKGHANYINFVGLSVYRDFLACGSETNEVYVYHKAMSKPLTWHRFGTLNVEDSDEDGRSDFVSAVCWKSDSPTMLAANSRGMVKVLVLAP
ncbi:hypothetical protein Lser_V15G22756 [Lactuca serriola]